MTDHRRGRSGIEFPNELEANFDNIDAYLRSLLDSEGAVSG